MRERIARAFAAHLHEETGLIHRKGMILMRDNLLYVLSLFQRKTKEDGLEAGRILARLLAFRVAGGLPSYLHTFPNLPDPAHTVRLLLVLKHLARFDRLMDPALRGELTSLILEMEQIESEGLSFLSRFKLATLRGEKIDVPSFDASSSAARADVAETLAYVGDVTSLFALYHPYLEHFCPPGYFELFEGSHLKRSVLDALANPSVEGDVLFDAPLFPKEIELPPFQPVVFTGEKNGLSWRSELMEHGALSWVEKGEEMVSYHASNFYPFMLFWKGHNCVMDQPKGFLSFAGEAISMRFSGSYAQESRETRTLMTLYFDAHPELAFYSEGRPATLFKMGEEIEVRAEGMQMKLRFDSRAPLVVRLGIGSRSGESPTDKILALEALDDLHDAEVALSGLKEALSMATPIACIPLST